MIDGVAGRCFRIWFTVNLGLDEWLACSLDLILPAHRVIPGRGFAPATISSDLFVTTPKSVNLEIVTQIPGNITIPTSFSGVLHIASIDLEFESAAYDPAVSLFYTSPLSLASSLF